MPLSRARSSRFATTGTMSRATADRHSIPRHPLPKEQYGDPRKVNRMLIALSVLAVVAVAWLLLLRQGTNVARAHAMTLSVRTGIPVGQICGEMLRNGLTPGEWAVRHGLHPITFEPIDDPRGRAA